MPPTAGDPRVRAAGMPACTEPLRWWARGFGTQPPRAATAAGRPRQGRPPRPGRRRRLPCGTVDRRHQLPATAALYLTAQRTAALGAQPPRAATADGRPPRGRPPKPGHRGRLPCGTVDRRHQLPATAVLYLTAQRAAALGRRPTTDETAIRTGTALELCTGWGMRRAARRRRTRAPFGAAIGRLSRVPLSRPFVRAASAHLRLRCDHRRPTRLRVLSPAGRRVTGEAS